MLDVDGAEIEVGDDLYSVEGNLKFHVSHVDRINGKIATDAMFSLDKWADPSLFTHRTPVLAADGRPLREGETVWNETGLSFKVTSTNSKNNSFKAVRDLDGSKCYLNPRLFTHERPDSFQKLWDDLSYGDVSEAEFMRRAKALAGGA